MAQNKVKTLKGLEVASMWCAIASLLVFFANLIAFIAILVLGIKNNFDTSFDAAIYKLTLITEYASMALILGWIVMAIIEMVMIKKNKELQKYHYGSFTAWIIAMVLSIGFMFLSLFIFVAFVENAQTVVYITFVLYLASTSGSIIYLASVSRSLRRINDSTK